MRTVFGSDDRPGTETRTRRRHGRPDHETTQDRRSAGGVALKFLARLIRPTIVTGMMAALIATADTPTVVPLGCGITWTRVGGAFIATPGVCPHQSPASQPSPDGPPPDPGTPPGAPPTP
jgi:hypothetical protein